MTTFSAVQFDKIMKEMEGLPKPNYVIVAQDVARVINFISSEPRSAREILKECDISGQRFRFIMKALIGLGYVEKTYGKLQRYTLSKQACMEIGKE